MPQPRTYGHSSSLSGNDDEAGNVSTLARDSLSLDKRRPHMTDACFSGLMLKWTNYWMGWQERFFALHDGILSYYRSEEDICVGCRGAVRIDSIMINEHAESCGLDVVGPDFIWYLKAQECVYWDWMRALRASVHSPLACLDASMSAVDGCEDDTCSRLSETEYNQSVLDKEILEIERMVDRMKLLTMSADAHKQKKKKKDVNPSDRDSPVALSTCSDEEAGRLVISGTNNNRNGDKTNITVISLRPDLEQRAQNAVANGSDHMSDYETARTTKPMLQAARLRKICTELSTFELSTLNVNEGLMSIRAITVASLNAKLNNGSLCESQSRDEDVKHVGKCRDDGTKNADDEEEEDEEALSSDADSGIEPSETTSGTASVSRSDELASDDEDDVTAVKPHIKVCLQMSDSHKAWLKKITDATKHHLKVDREPLSSRWQHVYSENGMTMYRKEKERNGVAEDPLRMDYTVTGVTAFELCWHFWNWRYRLDWDTSVEAVDSLETIDDHTMMLYQMHKRIWPSAQRDSCFLSQISPVAEETNDMSSTWIVVNLTASHERAKSKEGIVRLQADIAFTATSTITPRSLENHQNNNSNRSNISTKITYVATVNPGGWVPASALRAIAKKEFPLFLRRFSKYVVEKMKDTPVCNDANSV